MVLEQIKSIDQKRVKGLMASLPELKNRQVLIIGDVGLDEYIMGDVRRISPEAPVPVIEVDREETRMGMSANVAQNVLSLGGDPLLLSVIGDDRGAEHLRHLFKEGQLSSEGLVVDSSRPTTKKARIMAKHHHIVRVDYEQRRFLSKEIEAQLLERVSQQIENCHCIVIQDYAKGVISENSVREIVKLAKTHGKVILADPHRSTPVEHYRGVSLFKPNFEEAVALSGMKFDELRDDDQVILKIGEKLLELTQSQEVVLTCGKDGMLVFKDGQITRVPTYARQVFDVTGAGDTVIATLALGLSAGLPLEDACLMANFAAGVVVGKVGCVPCSQEDLKAYMESHIED